MTTERCHIGLPKKFGRGSRTKLEVQSIVPHCAASLPNAGPLNSQVELENQLRILNLQVLAVFGSHMQAVCSLHGVLVARVCLDSHFKEHPHVYLEAYMASSSLVGSSQFWANLDCLRKDVDVCGGEGGLTSPVERHACAALCSSRVSC